MPPWNPRAASTRCCVAWRAAGAAGGRRVGAEDTELESLSGPRSRTDRLLQPLNRLATKRFLRESRAKVWANTRLLNAARRTGPDAYATRLAELEHLAATRVADLMAPGQVVLKLAVKGFGVHLQDA